MSPKKKTDTNSGLIKQADDPKLYKKLLKTRDFAVLVKTFVLSDKVIEDNITAETIDQPVIDMNSVVIHQKLSKSFMEKHFTKFDPVKLAKFQVLSEEFIAENMHRLDHSSIAQYQKLSEEFILSVRKTATWNWNIIITCQNISEATVNQLIPDGIIDFSLLARHVTLSEAFIDRNSARLNMNHVSMFQKLSEGFIQGHLDILNKQALLINKNLKLTDAFIKKYLA